MEEGLWKRKERRGRMVGKKLQGGGRRKEGGCRRERVGSRRHEIQVGGGRS